MAIGDDALAVGFPLVPSSGEEGRVRWGAREINRTRDFVAQLKSLVPNNKAGFQSASGIIVGTAAPSSLDGEDGDIYFQISETSGTGELIDGGEL